MMTRKFDFDGPADAGPPVYAEPDDSDEPELGEVPVAARADLYCTTPPSNKEYHLTVEEVDGGFVVNYGYGAIGSTLKYGTKTPRPVDRKAAMKVFEALVAEKLAKDYRPRVDGTSVAAPAVGYVSPTGMKREEDAVAVALLEPVDDPEPYIRGTQWVAQPKYDGKRMLLKITGGVVTAQNRRGLTIVCPPLFQAPLRALGQPDIVLDGEAVGDVFYAFDIVRLNAADLRQEPYARRLLTLQSLFAKPGTVIRLAETATSTAEKEDLYKRLKRDRGEGIVFKRTDATYQGRRSADMVKHKFWASVSVLVLARNDTGALLEEWQGWRIRTNKPDGKRSIQAGLLGPKSDPMFVGDVSVPVNYPVPEPGTVAEIRYLYAFPATNKLFQPQYEGERDDVDPDTLDRLKYKGEE